jgi:predicted dehydrogenase
MPSGKWKVGLIGTGFWSEKHLKAWKRIENVEIAALCNRSEGKLREKAAQFGVSGGHLYTSVDDMLASEDMDIVDIVTGPETHLEFVRKASAAGKQILCQKPFAPTLEDAQEMVRTAAKAGVRLMVTENWRWLEPYQAVKRVLREGRLGAPRVIRYRHTDFYTPRMAPGVELPQPFFRTMPRLLFYEMGPHWFDTWRFLFGTPRRLFAETARVSRHVTGEDSGVIVLGHDEYYGFLDMSWATRQALDQPLGSSVGPVHREQLIVDGEEGTLKLYTDGTLSLVDERGQEETLAGNLSFDHEESHFRLQSHFIHCLDSGAPFQTSGEDNLLTLQMVFGVYESARRHVSVTIGS